MDIGWILSYEMRESMEERFRMEGMDRKTPDPGNLRHFRARAERGEIELPNFRQLDEGIAPTLMTPADAPARVTGGSLCP